MAAPTLQRRPLVKQILAGADDDLLVIAGLGSPNWDITEAGDRPLNMPLWGAMGAPVSMGLGLAIAQPKKRVLVITGDADMMMSIGSLATVASQQPDNLAICVLDNEKFGETGNQASHTSPRNNGPTDSGAGADLAIVDIDPATAADAAEEIRGLGRRSISLSANVADGASVARMTADAIAGADEGAHRGRRDRGRTRDALPRAARDPGPRVRSGHPVAAGDGGRVPLRGDAGSA